jgi:hypothetical protein
LKATWRAPAAFVIGIVFVAGGCDAAKPYRTVLREQTEAYTELERIYSSVTDQKSMAAASAKIAAQKESFEAIAKRAQKLPPPSENIQRELLEEAEQLRLALAKFNIQANRIKSLPGGPEFLEILKK